MLQGLVNKQDEDDDNEDAEDETAMFLKDIYRLPEQLFVALRTDEKLERSFYIAYCEWRDIPDDHVSAIM